MSHPLLRKTRKILVRTILAVVLLIVVLVASSPWWLGWALGIGLKGTGASFDTYEREGYSSFRLREISYDDDASGLHAEVTSLQMPTLPALLWKKITGATTDLQIGEVAVRQGAALEPTQATPEPGGPIVPAALARQAFDALDLLDNWPVEIAVEQVVYESGETRVTLKQPHYAAGEFTVEAASSLNKQVVTLTLRRDSADELRLKAEVSPEPVQLEMTLTLASASELSLSGELGWREQPASFRAKWAGPGLLPGSAHLEAHEWTLPDELLAKEDRPGYERPQGSVQADWDGQRYKLVLDVSAEPVEDSLSPLTAHLEASGDERTLDLQTLAIEGGWITASLAEPVAIPLTSLQDLPPAQFNLKADLSGQQFFPAKGTVSASLVADDRPDNDYPLVTATFTAKGLAYEDYHADNVTVEAQLDWPQLSLERLSADLPEESSLALNGSYDLEQETFTAIKAKLAVTGKLAQTFAPDVPAFESLTADFTLDGPRAQVRHEGDIVLKQFEWADDRMDINLHWRGVHGALEVLTGQGGGDTLDFDWEGDADLGMDAQRLSLNKASFRPHGYADLTLQEPVTLSHEADGTVRLSPLRIGGSEGGQVQAQAQVRCPESGSLSLNVSDVSPVWLKVLSDAKLPFTTTVKLVQADVNWEGGPMVYTMKAEATAQPEGQQPVDFTLALAGDGNGLRIERLRAGQGETALAQAQGELPLVIEPAAPSMIELPLDAPANFQLVARPGSTHAWRWLQEHYHLILKEPSLDLELKGSLGAPTGKLSVGLTQLEVAEGGDLPAIPKTEDLHLEATFAPDEVTISRMGLLLEERPLAVTARLPMSTDAWSELFSEGKAPEIEQASGKLHLDTVPLSAFATYLPDVLRDSGTLDLRADLKPGLDWTGELAIEGVETMPLPQIGSVSGIGAQLSMDKTQLTITRASAQIGGQELAITGQVDAKDLEDPRFDLAIKGENIPFVRSPGLIVRGSPDLTLKTDEAGVTTLGGTVTLNESFFTIDLTSLGTGGGGGNAADPNRRFPYFSIEDEPLADWRLNIDVEGKEFLRVRIPVFEGIVSADLSMLGTLREPMAIGQAVIDQGVVLFPFSNLRLQQGTVTIRQDQPYDPILDVTATGRAYGYDLVMRLTGTPDDPQLSFSSTPALEQGDILLMITAGRMPDSDQRSTQSRLTGLGVFIGNSILVDLGLVDPLDDQLQVFVGEDVTLTGKDTIRVIYRIDDNWAIVGQYDRFDSYTLDFKWTIYQD